MMSRTLGVSRSGFYAYLNRPPSDRQVADDALTDWIAAIHEGSKQTYGAPRIHAELADEGVHVGRKRIERLMKAKGLRGVSRRKFVVTTEREGNTHRSAAAQFRVSVKFVNDMAKLKRRTGSLAPKRQGNGGWSKLGRYDD